MHLSHPANTLLAEIQLAADGTVLRTKDEQLVLEADQLICCGAYGGLNRSSDPNIGNSVNQLAQLGILISLQDPVALYMDSLNTAGWTKPDGKTPVGNYWKIIRGQPGMMVRAVCEVPPEEGFIISDILIGGEPLKYAGQIAQGIKMKLTGAGFFPQIPKKPNYVPCQYYCCCQNTNTSNLRIVPLAQNCGGGFQHADPGIELPPVKVPSVAVAEPMALEALPTSTQTPARPRRGRQLV